MATLFLIHLNRRLKLYNPINKSDKNIVFVSLPTEVDVKGNFVYSDTTTSMQTTSENMATVFLIERLSFLNFSNLT